VVTRTFLNWNFRSPERKWGGTFAPHTVNIIGLHN